MGRFSFFGFNEDAFVLASQLKVKDKKIETLSLQLKNAQAIERMRYDECQKLKARLYDYHLKKDEYRKQADRAKARADKYKRELEQLKCKSCTNC